MSRSKSPSSKPKVVIDREKNVVKVGNKKYELFTAANGSLYYKAPFTTKDGKKGTRPRFVAGSDPKYMEKLRRKSAVSRRRRSASRSRADRKVSIAKRNAAASRAFVRHYSKSRYATEKGRKIAMSRDANQGNQEITSSLKKYRSNPAKYDMVGVDAGEHKNVKEMKKSVRKNLRKSQRGGFRR
jgi:hypothetical protein